MILTGFFLLLALVGVLAVIMIFVLGMFGIVSGRPKTQTLKRLGVIFMAATIMNLGLVALSQRTASTPVIVDQNGERLEGSIAELTSVELNGRKQWISLRGWDQRKPILLFLAGGPGGTQMAAVRHELGQLEKHFVVVGWDQPGAGKSYYVTDHSTLSLETYIQDGLALTNYLRERFHQDKIYLVGESWGSALGIFLVERNPEWYYAFLGTGQMVDFGETERMDYLKAWELAEEKGDKALLKKLGENGPPPYYGQDVTWKIAAYVNYLGTHMNKNSAIHNSGYNTLRDLFSPEYSLLDKINFIRGLLNTFGHVYQQLYPVDLRVRCANLNIPIYFFEGRHDLNAPPSLVEEYLEQLVAPVKELVWFEHSGHNPWINEKEKFMYELIRRFTLH